jgi:AP-3 complex subunit delta-1
LSIKNILLFRASVRKKSVIALYKVCLQHPDALPLVLPRLREKCKDPDPTVQSSVISIFCELSQKNPKDFLCLAPIFYSMLKNSSTWMLIKIIKIFNRLMPLEPRLAKKLISPLTEIISTTPSLALLYETISAALHALSRRENLMQLCASKLSSFFERDDHNLRYLGLHALKKVMKINLELAIPQMDLILQCLESSDEVILFQSVDLLLGLLSKENFKKIIDRLCATVQTVFCWSLRFIISYVKRLYLLAVVRQHGFPGRSRQQNYIHVPKASLQSHGRLFVVLWHLASIGW